MVKLRSQLVFWSVYLHWAGINLTKLQQSCGPDLLSLALAKGGCFNFITVGGRFGSGSSGTAGLLPWRQHIAYHCGCGTVPLPQKQTLEIPREKVMEDLQLKFYRSLSLHTLLGRDFLHLSSNQRHHGATSFAHTCCLPCLQLLLLEQQGRALPAWAGIWAGLNAGWLWATRRWLSGESSCTRPQVSWCFNVFVSNWPEIIISQLLAVWRILDSSGRRQQGICK